MNRRRSGKRPIVKRIAKIAQAGWKNGVWVGLGHLTAEQVAAGDTTLPQVTNSYATKGALEAAIADGSAFEVAND